MGGGKPASSRQLALPDKRLTMFVSDKIVNTAKKVQRLTGELTAEQARLHKLKEVRAGLSTPEGAQLIKQHQGPRGGLTAIKKMIASHAQAAADHAAAAASTGRWALPDAPRRVRIKEVTDDESEGEESEEESDLSDWLTVYDSPVQQPSMKKRRSH